LEEEVGGGSNFGFVVGVAIPGNFGQLGEVDESLAGGVEAKLLVVQFKPTLGEGCFLEGDRGVLLGDANVITL